MEAPLEQRIVGGDVTSKSARSCGTDALRAAHLLQAHTTAQSVVSAHAPIASLPMPPKALRRKDCS